MFSLLGSSSKYCETLLFIEMFIEKKELVISWIDPLFHSDSIGSIWNFAIFFLENGQFLKNDDWIRYTCAMIAFYFFLNFKTKTKSNNKKEIDYWILKQKLNRSYSNYYYYSLDSSFRRIRMRKIWLLFSHSRTPLDDRFLMFDGTSGTLTTTMVLLTSILAFILEFFFRLLTIEPKRLSSV